MKSKTCTVQAYAINAPACHDGRDKHKRYETDQQEIDGRDTLSSAQEGTDLLSAILHAQDCDKGVVDCRHRFQRLRGSTNAVRNCSVEFCQILASQSNFAASASAARPRAKQSGIPSPLHY